MSVYLISYNADNLETNYPGLHGAIKSFDAVRLMKTAWLIETSDSADTVYERLETYMEKGADLLVIEVTQDYQGELNRKACDWMREHLDPEPEPKKGLLRRLIFG